MDNTNEIMSAIDAAFDKATKPVMKASTPSSSTTFANPEEYRKQTGKRFRMTKEEKRLHGDDETARQKAFEERMKSGLLEM
jgi:hypothetical protein